MPNSLMMNAVIMRVILKATIHGISVAYFLWIFKRIHIHALRNISIMISKNMLGIDSTTTVLYQILLLPLDAVTSVAPQCSHRLTCIQLSDRVINFNLVKETIIHFGSLPWSRSVRT